MHRITTSAQLDRLYGEPVPAAIVKEIDYISDHYRAFIDKSPFVVMATVGPEGLIVPRAATQLALSAYAIPTPF